MDTSKAFNGDPFVRRELEKLIAKHGVLHAIETGTWAAESTLAFREMVEGRVVTIETDLSHLPEEWQPDPVSAMAELGITLVHGDSGECLAGVISSLECGPERILFYLDAHAAWNPLLEELRQIAAWADEPVIAIHDFATGHQELGYNTGIFAGNSAPLCMPLIERHLDAIYPDGYGYNYNSPEKAGGAMRGLVYIYPREE